MAQTPVNSAQDLASSRVPPGRGGLPPAFEEHLTQAFTELRGSIQDLLASLRADSLSAPEMARRLDLSRNLTWKVSKVLSCPDLYEALQHLPGDAGLDLFLGAASAHGGPGAAVERVRSARVSLDRVVEIHLGDRATLELILDGMAGGTAQRLEQSRKLAFRGNSGLWGLQARARVVTTVLAPNTEDPSTLDIAQVGGLVDLRRLRADVRWPLFRPHWYMDDGRPRATSARDEPIDPAFGDPMVPRLIGDFCSTHTPPIAARRDSRGWVYELTEGRVGNTGAFTCFFGTLTRGGAPRYRTETDRTGEVGSHITLPVELLQFDVLFHRDLDFVASASVSVRAAHDGADDLPDASAAPIGERPRELAGRPPVVSSREIPRYEELVQRVFERAGWEARDFRGVRLSLPYPPMHSLVALRFDLPRG